MIAARNKFTRRFLRWAGVILVIFYVGFALVDGPVWARDSASYTGMTIGREPVYPLFLAFFRMIFGEEAGRNGLPAYLFPVVIVQSLVNAYAVWVLVKAVLNGVGGESEGTGTVTHSSGEERVTVPVPLTHLPLAALAGDFHLIVALLNRFAAGRGSMYSEAILTESLAMPLYLIFVVRLWETYSKNLPLEGAQGPGDLGSARTGAERRQGNRLRWRRCHTIRLAILAFLLIGLRKQMAVVLLLWGVVAVVDCFRKCIKGTGESEGTGTMTHFSGDKGDGSECHRPGSETAAPTKRKVTFRTVPFVTFPTIISIILVLLAGNGFERAYNAAVHDRAVPHTGNGKGLMCTLLYSADPDEDTVFFQNCQTGGLCELFTDILASCDDMGILKKNLDEGSARYYISADGQQVEGAAFENTGSWLDLGEHYAASYDIIGYEVCDPMIAEYLAARGFTGVDVEIAYDTIASEFNRVLMKQKKGDLIRVFCVNFIKGLVATNARIHPALVPVSLVLYVVYVVMYVLLWRGDKGDGSECHRPHSETAAPTKRKVTFRTVPFVTSNRNESLRFAEITFLAILINTGVVGLMIFPQPRYMIYNMGLFYTALAMMAFMLYSKVWITKKRTKEKS